MISMFYQTVRKCVRDFNVVPGIFVRAVDPTGVAGREGSLRVGDQLLEASGRSLTGLTHKQSASVIRVSVRLYYRESLAFLKAFVFVWSHFA